MPSQHPLAPCPRCTSTRFAHVPSLVVLVPFLSAMREKLEKEKRGEVRKGRSGDAVVCLGCGKIELFMQGFDTLLEHPGVTEMQVGGFAPYRA